jgi:hypothetical protein
MQRVAGSEGCYVSINIGWSEEYVVRDAVEAYVSDTMRTCLRTALVVGVVLSAIPYRTITVPAWRIRFTDEGGTPFRSLPVNQTWRNYSVEAHDHHASGITDEDGYAQFPERSMWAPLVLRAIGPIQSVLRAGAHAGFGSSAWVITPCDLSERGSRLATYWERTSQTT